MNEMSGAGDIEIRWGERVRLRDGVSLCATVYVPKCWSSPLPCVLTMTPYIADTNHARGVYFAMHGLPFVLVDVRGRGNSEGVFSPIIQEGTDGYDAVEWLSGQPYCNGQVAMWGGSYLGYSQWATAKEFPPHLATIVPTAAPFMGMEFPMRNNIFLPYILQWLTFTAGRASQTQIFSDAFFWSESYRKWHESGRPFRDLDAVLGKRLPVFQEWISHPYPDAYWDACNPTAAQYSRLDIPILTITGSYDDDQPGALEHYKRHMRCATASARERHFLIIGPWDHRGTATPRLEFGGLKFAAASLIDLPTLHVQWYAWTMQRGAKPEFLRQPVAYYVMGEECWRYADTLDEITSHYKTLFLESTGGANDVFASGSLGIFTGQGLPDSYTYDPRVADASETEAEARTTGDSLIDQSVTFALRGKMLVYHSAPFDADLEISGFFRLRVWIAIDCPDTDIYVSIHEIGLDGGSIRLSTDAIRARYREGLRNPKLVKTCEPLRYDFERFTFVSRQVKLGHRLRLIFAPIGRLLDTTFAERNYNGGGVVAEESIKDARPVTVKIFHDGSHPSALEIPIGRV